MIPFASALPIEPEAPQPLARAVKALEAARAAHLRKFYERPVPANAKAVMNRIIGDRDD
jgi:hypothetical protein